MLMDPSQFQAFLDKLNEISKSLEEMLDKQEEAQESGGKEKRPGLFNRDRTPSRLSSKEKKLEGEKGAIYAKEFMKLFEGLESDRKKNENKVNEMFKKNLIKVSLEWVGRRAIDQLKGVLNESTLKNVKDKRANAAASAGGGLLGGLAGGLGGVLGAFNALIPMIMAIGGIAVLITLVKNIDKVGEFLKTVLPGLGDFLVKVLPAAGETIIKLINGLLPALQTFLTYLKEILFKVLDSLPSILKSVSDAIMPIINKIFDFFSNLDIPGILKTIFDGVKGLLEIIAAQIPVIIPPVMKLAGFIKEILISVVNSLPDILRGLKGVINSITGFAKVALPIISDFVGKIFNFVLALMPHIKDIVMKYLEVMKNIIITISPYVKDIIATVFSGLEKIGPILRDVIFFTLNKIETILLKLLDTVRDVAPYFTKQVEAVKDAIVALSKPLDSLIQKLGDILIKTLDTIKEGIISTRENLKTLSGMLRGISLTDFARVAAGVTALGVAMATFGLADGAGKLFQAAGSFFSLGKNKSAVDTILELAKNENEIYSVASSLKMLNEVVKESTSLTQGDKFYAEMKKVSAGIALITNVDKIENLDKLKNLTDLKDIFSSKVSSPETVNVKMSEIDRVETATAFSGIYSVTTKVNEKMDSINYVLDDLNGKFSEMLRLQSKHANLAAESVDYLEGINNKDDSKSNVMVANSNSNIIFNEKSTSQFDFRREMAMRFASNALT